MSEKILKINEASVGEGWGRMDGYRVVTTKQDVELLIDAEQQCCESAGYFWCNDNPEDFIGAKLLDIRITGEGLNEEIMKRNELDPSENYFEGGVMFVDIITSRGVLQFVAYNEHNGYYGHEATVKSTQLNFKEYL